MHKDCLIKNQIGENTRLRNFLKIYDLKEKLWPGRGGDMALDELPPLVIGSVVLKEPAAMLLDPVWLEQLLRFEPANIRTSERVEIIKYILCLFLSFVLYTALKLS